MTGRCLRVYIRFFYNFLAWPDSGILASRHLFLDDLRDRDGMVDIYGYMRIYGVLGVQ